MDMYYYVQIYKMRFQIQIRERIFSKFILNIADISNENVLYNQACYTNSTLRLMLMQCLQKNLFRDAEGGEQPMSLKVELKKLVFRTAKQARPCNLIARIGVVN